MYQNITIQIFSVLSDIEDILPHFTATLHLQEFVETQSDLPDSEQI